MQRLYKIGSIWIKSDSLRRFHRVVFHQGIKTLSDALLSCSSASVFDHMAAAASNLEAVGGKSTRMTEVRFTYGWTECAQESTKKIVKEIRRLNSLIKKEDSEELLGRQWAEFGTSLRRLLAMAKSVGLMLHHALSEL